MGVNLGDFDAVRRGKFGSLLVLEGFGDLAHGAHGLI